MIIISTYNRKDLTGVCLTMVKHCKTRDFAIIDDCSSEYGEEWLRSFGAIVEREPNHLGVGAMARRRIEFALTYPYFENENLFIFLDNDILVTPHFEDKCIGTYQALRANIVPVGGMIFSPYLSSTHEIVESPFGVHRMKDIGGAALTMDRITCRILLDRIPVEKFDNQWDYRINEICPVFAASVSWVEHVGRFGGGVNGVSEDKALNFIGY